MPKTPQEINATREANRKRRAEERKLARAQATEWVPATMKEDVETEMHRAAKALVRRLGKKVQADA